MSIVLMLAMILIVSKAEENQTKPIEPDHRKTFNAAKECSVHNYPYFVHLSLYNDSKPTKYCGGSIIDRDKVLTSGTCCSGRNRGAVFTSPRRIWVGSKLMKDFDEMIMIRTMETHPDFNMDCCNIPMHDLCIIRLVKPLKLTSKAKLVRVATNANGLNFALGTHMLFMEFGYVVGEDGSPRRNESRPLECIDGILVHRRNCFKLFPKFDDNVMYCLETQTRDPIDSELGAPVTYDNVQIGVVTIRSTYTVVTKVDLAYVPLRQHVNCSPTNSFGALLILCLSLNLTRNKI